MRVDIEIFNSAVYWARVRRDWRYLADQGGTARHTRRQCLHHARKAEAYVVDQAIRAENRTRRAGA